MTYTVKLHRDVEKQLSRIPRKQQERLVQAIRSLSVEPRPTGCLHLQDALFRIREGEYRIIYAVFDEEVIVIVCQVSRRTEKTYRDLEALLERAIRGLGAGTRREP